MSDIAWAGSYWWYMYESRIRFSNKCIRIPKHKGESKFQSDKCASISYVSVTTVEIWFHIFLIRSWTKRGYGWSLKQVFLFVKVSLSIEEGKSYRIVIGNEIKFSLVLVKMIFTDTFCRQILYLYRIFELVSSRSFIIDLPKMPSYNICHVLYRIENLLMG